MKRAVYENITRNFDIFEFIDDRGEVRANNNANEGDDEMSEELEFEIDDNDNIMASMFFNTE
jgi:hypothetical protein